jgi:hypothetical protein
MCMMLSRITGRGKPRVARVRAVAKSGSGVTREAHSDTLFKQTCEGLVYGMIGITTLPYPSYASPIMSGDSTMILQDRCLLACLDDTTGGNFPNNLYVHKYLIKI